MFRYLPGILLLQTVTVALGWASLNFGGDAGWWQWLIPAALLAVVTSLWFASIERAGHRAAIEKLRMSHAHEREKLKVAVEKDKARIQEQATRTIRREERRVARRANLKVGGAFLLTTVAGVLLLITELFTLGFMTITTAVGAMGGYLIRGRSARLATDPQRNALPGGSGNAVWIEGEKPAIDNQPTDKGSTGERLPANGSATRAGKALTSGAMPATPPAAGGKPYDPD